MSVVLNLAGKVAIVTGASRGIGESIARCFVDNGAKVVLAARKMESLEALASDLNSRPSPGAPHGEERAFAVSAHTGREADCVALVQAAIKKFGKVDVLVNNAGTNPYFGPTIDAPEAAWDKTFEVNLKGYFWLIREVTKHLQAREAPGSLISIASTSGLIASPLQGVYSMTKAAVIAMTRTLAVELAPNKIRVNVIAPGFVDTKFSSAVVKNDTLLDEVLRMTPMKRIATADEVAGGALYLASDSASYLTGHTLVIDGGMTIA